MQFLMDMNTKEACIKHYQDSFVVNALKISLKESDILSLIRHHSWWVCMNKHIQNLVSIILQKNMQVYFNYSIKFTKPQAPETAADTL